MKWIATRVQFESENNPLAAELVADIFYDLGLKGVVIEDPTADPEADWAEDAVPLPAHYAVTGYFPDNRHLADKCGKLESRIASLKSHMQIKWEISHQRMDEEDWAESWKEHFWPQRITPNMVVKPTWRDFSGNPGDMVIEIDPGMAFGTGTHATTVLCMRMMQQYLKPGQSVLDVGTGSGILLVTAAKLGAGSMMGIDIDEVAVAVAEKNLRLNHVSPKCYTVKSGTLTSGVSQRFDVVVANILSHVIIQLLDDVSGVMTENGMLVASGIIEKNRREVEEKMAAVGFEVMETALEDEWVVIVAKRSREVSS